MVTPELSCENAFGPHPEVHVWCNNGSFATIVPE